MDTEIQGEGGRAEDCTQNPKEGGSGGKYQYAVGQMVEDRPDGGEAARGEAQSQPLFAPHSSG